MRMRVIISAGGTGGHIYPALAIINKIREKDSSSEFLYIGTHNRMEKDIVPAAGFKYEPIEIYGFSKKDIKRDIKNIGLILKAEKKCLKIMKEFKPDVVIGVGGYVTYPVLRAAKKLKIKTFIHEQNSIPGKSNKVLSRGADLIGVSFEDSLKYFGKNAVLTGNPCGERAIDIAPTLKSKYGIDKKRKCVLIVQGSLGSNVMNNKMKSYLSSIKDEDYDVIYVTGKDYYDSFSSNKFSSNVHIVPFIDNMSALMKDIDIIVTRAGASVISEIMALGKVSILIPSPYVANNHQYYNAKSLEDNKAAIMILEKDFSGELLKEKISTLFKDKLLYNQISKNVKGMSVDNSSTLIYNLLKDLIK